MMVWDWLDSGGCAGEILLLILLYTRGIGVVLLGCMTGCIHDAPLAEALVSLS
jgi:hypothetical protein